MEREEALLIKPKTSIQEDYAKNTNEEYESAPRHLVNGHR